MYNPDNDELEEDGEELPPSSECWDLPDEALGAEAGPVRTSLQETIDAAVCKLIAAPAVAEKGGKKK